MATRDFTVPNTVTITNKSEEDIAIRYFRVNFVETLAPEDEIVLTAASSEEAAYYKALADETIGLEVKLETEE